MYRNNLVYNLQESKLFIYNKIKKENPQVNLSLTKYYKLCPKNFQYSKKKTDMCDICINGKKLTKKNDKKNENTNEKQFLLQNKKKMFCLITIKCSSCLYFQRFYTNKYINNIETITRCPVSVWVYELLNKCNLYRVIERRLL